MYKVWPMGCKKVKDESHLQRLILDPNYIAQRKIDGVRCILHIDDLGYVRYTTRGQSVNNPGVPLEITHRLEHLQVKYPKLANTILDGELFCDGMTSAEIAGQVSYKSSVNVCRGIRLNIFDLLMFQGKKLYQEPLKDRLSVLYPLFHWLDDERHIIVPFEYESYRKELLLMEEFEAGREGVVFKNLLQPYKLGKDKEAKPTDHWYKYKKVDTVDVVITGAEPPEQYYRDPDTRERDFSRATKPWVNGWLGSITFKFDEQTGSCSGITDHMKEQLSDGKHGIKPEYIGRIMEVEFFEKTADGNLRHPRFVRIREEIEK